jgi:hypothetical protein
MSLGAEELAELWQEDLMCETVITIVLKSVARTRLVKTENPSACVTVNCKVRRVAIAL